MPIRKNRIRLPAYDYAQSNHYYVTICTHLKEELFGKIADNNVILNESGKMVEQTLFESSEFYPGISIDQFVVMPNHVHAIIIIFNETNTLLDSNSVQEVSHKYSLSDIIHNIKSLTTKRYIDGVKNCNWKLFSKKLWQRSYYDHIIRNEHSLIKIREYIKNNPANWDDDSENKD